MEYLISKCAVAFVAAVDGNPAVATHLSSNFRPPDRWRHFLPVSPGGHPVLVGARST
ncbi:hypothetical protein D9M69_211710 [compost metagenome]